jgi:hypothetical protein
MESSRATIAFQAMVVILTENGKIVNKTISLKYFT